MFKILTLSRSPLSQLSFSHDSEVGSGARSSIDPSNSPLVAIGPISREDQIKKQDLSIEQIKEWVDAHRSQHNGAFPTLRGERVLNSDGSPTREKWTNIDNLFRSAAKGRPSRGLQGTGYTSLSDFLAKTYPAEYKARKVVVNLGDLLVPEIKKWVEAYRQKHKQEFPNLVSGEVFDPDGRATGETWQRIDAAFRDAARGRRARGLQGAGYESLLDFLDKTYPEERKVRVKKQDLSIEQLTEWVEVYRAAHKLKFPTEKSGTILNANGQDTGDTWKIIDRLFKSATESGRPSRGLKDLGFTSLSDFLDKTYPDERKVRVKKQDLSIDQIKGWVDAYRQEHKQKFPATLSGEIFNADGGKAGEMWIGIDALFKRAAQGYPARGLKDLGFTSLSDFLDKTYPDERKVRVKRQDLSAAQIKGWVDVYRELHAGEFPKWSSGDVFNTDGSKAGETWKGIARLFWYAAQGARARGLRDAGFISLEDFLDKTYPTERVKSVVQQAELESIRALLNDPEAQALRNLAAILGEAALAEYLVAAYQERFSSYNADFVENLRRYLGEIDVVPHVQTEGALPEGLFTIEKLEHLRQALFNSYRDSYQPLFAQGLSVVTERLKFLGDVSSSEYQQKFLTSLIEYFSAVDALPHPLRLKRSLNEAYAFPAAHQRMPMYEVSQSRRLLLADEMGGGKTGSAIASFELLRQQQRARRCLIICPAKVLQVWRAALSDDQAGYFKSGMAPGVTFIDQESRDWDSAQTSDYTVISLEMTRGQSDGRSIVERLREIDFDFMIFDEAHNARNPRRANTDTERVFEISQSTTLRGGFLMLLSGTPIPNTVQDLAAHIRLLYAGSEEASNLNVQDVGDLAKTIIHSQPLLVRNLLVRKMMRRKTEECLPIGCEYRREHVVAQLEPVSRAIYNTILEDPLLLAGQKIPMLRRCCLDAKFDALRTAIDKALSDEKYSQAGLPPKIVIAESLYARGVTRDNTDARVAEEPGRETYLYSRLQNAYGEGLQVFVLDGKNSVQREEILRAFHECPQPACLLTLISVSGEGLDMTCAADAILISPTNTVSSEEQFVRRLLRTGQRLPVRLQVLSFSDTIEEGILGFSARKHRVVGAVMDGRPLTPRERAVLEDDFSAVRQHGPVAYETLTPRQQALWILRRLKGQGKEGIHRFLYADNGKYAKDFARGYPIDEESSLSGNTARLVTAVIERLRASQDARPLVVADIACGCRTLERMFEGARDITVKSVDLNEAALAAGAQLMKTPVEIRPDEELRTMDDLPCSDKSLDVGVVSLALHMTQHVSGRGYDGQERIRALLELNRTLKDGGKAILTFPGKFFPTSDAFYRFVSTIEEHFGFARCEGLTGLATAANSAEHERFAGWVITLEKTKTVLLEDLDIGSRSLWQNLRFPRRTAGALKGKGARTQPAQNKSGAYQDTFTIAGETLRFQPSSMRQCELLAQQNTERFEQKQLGARIEALLASYPTIKDIPPELLLSITPEVISQATQEERDQFYRVQIARFGSEDQIPTNIVNEKNSYILVRRFKRSKGQEPEAYLCLAKIRKDGKSWGSFGTKYFYQ